MWIASARACAPPPKNQPCEATKNQQNRESPTSRVTLETHGNNMESNKQHLEVSWSIPFMVYFRRIQWKMLLSKGRFFAFSHPLPHVSKVWPAWVVASLQGDVANCHLHSGTCTALRAGQDGPGLVRKISSHLICQPYACMISGMAHIWVLKFHLAIKKKGQTMDVTLPLADVRKGRLLLKPSSLSLSLAVFQSQSFKLWQGCSMWGTHSDLQQPFC